VPVHVDLSAADEARIDLAAREQSHEVERARAPRGPAHVRRVAHGVEELRRRVVADDPKLEQADRVRRVRPFGENERDERQPHADEDLLAVADLACGLGDHDLSGTDVRHFAVSAARSAFQRSPSFARYASWSGTSRTHSRSHASKPSRVRVARWYSWKNAW